MPNTYFKFKQFTINQDKTAMKVGVDGVLLGAWTNAENASNILDIGTGTGLLSLMLAQKSKASITAIEIDEKACEQAQLNFNKSKWFEKIKLINTSVQEFAKNSIEYYDLIICNPPYFTNSLNSTDEQRNLARHDILLPVNELLQCSKKLLTKNGQLYLIYPYDKMNFLMNEAEKHGFYAGETLIIKGTEQKRPNRFVVKLSFEKHLNNVNTLVVRNMKSSEYTIDYKQLTKDYYLAF